jgi:hypothetical protein
MKGLSAFLCISFVATSTCFQVIEIPWMEAMDPRLFDIAVKTKIFEQNQLLSSPVADYQKIHVEEAHLIENKIVCYANADGKLRIPEDSDEKEELFHSLYSYFKSLRIYELYSDEIHDSRSQFQEKDTKGYLLNDTELISLKNDLFVMRVFRRRLEGLPSFLPSDLPDRSTMIRCIESYQVAYQMIENNINKTQLFQEQYCPLMLKEINGRNLDNEWLYSVSGSLSSGEGDTLLSTKEIKQKYLSLLKELLNSRLERDNEIAIDPSGVSYLSFLNSQDIEFSNFLIEDYLNRTIEEFFLEKDVLCHTFRPFLILNEEKGKNEKIIVTDRCYYTNQNDLSVADHNAISSYLQKYRNGTTTADHYSLCDRRVYR